MTPARELRVWARVTVALMASVALVATLAMSAAGCTSEPGGGIDEETTTTVLVPTTTTTATPTTAPVSTAVSSTEPPTTTTSEASTTTTEAATTTTEAATTTSEALSSAETRLANGDIKGMGFIKEVWEEGGRRYISIDYAEMLSGEEARLAAIDAGYIEPDEDLPNDYFIRNVNPMLREFAVSPAVAITTSTLHGVMDQPATWEEFLSFWGSAPPEGATHLKDMPWWIVRTGTEIHSIDEQYLP